jgi:hypothetical protein
MRKDVILEEWSGKRNGVVAETLQNFSVRS